MYDRTDHALQISVENDRLRMDSVAIKRTGAVACLRCSSVTSCDGRLLSSLYGCRRELQSRLSPPERFVHGTLYRSIYYLAIIQGAMLRYSTTRRTAVP